MKIKLISPITEMDSYEYETLNETEVLSKIDLAESKFRVWKNTSFNERKSLLLKVSDILIQNQDEYSKIISAEMGKNIEDSKAEISKCSLVCKYYAENSESILKNEIIETEAENSFVKFEPLGVIFAVMPWNFPFWQVFRFAAPAVMAGNTVLLKHASNVPLCSLAIEKIFRDAGFDEGIFQSLLISSSESEIVIKDIRIKAVTLTGSENAGSKVASLAAKHLKKCVLELGGSDPFIVFDDADIDNATKAAAFSRMLVSGQSCIAAKRFLVHENVYDEFVLKMKNELSSIKYAPLISEDSLKTIDDQVNKSVKQGGKIVIGGKRDSKKGYYYQPTIIVDVTYDMPVWTEETFGPVAPIIKFKTEDEAIKIANNSRFGLGASVWTSDEERINRITTSIEAGSVFVNSIVKSDPRLPFGGTKLSGYGRELSSYGIKEFVNIKTIWIN